MAIPQTSPDRMLLHALQVLFHPHAPPRVGKISLRFFDEMRTEQRRFAMAQCWISPSGLCGCGAKNWFKPVVYRKGAGNQTELLRFMQQAKGALLVSLRCGCEQ